MVNPNKAKGTAFESDVAKMLQSWGFDAWRMAQTGAEDQGDIGGLKDWAFEVRNRAKLDLAKNVDDANDRARCKGSRYGVTVMKRRGRPVEDAYVAMDMQTFCHLLGHIYDDETECFCDS